MIERKYFETLCDNIFSSLRQDEHLTIGIAAEDTQFLRVTNSRVRQTGTVQDAIVELTCIQETGDGIRKASRSVNITGGDLDGDLVLLKSVAEALRREVPTLPVDRFAEVPKKYGALTVETRGQLLEREKVPEVLLEPLKGTSAAGIYASGPVIRGVQNSAGMRHWFETDQFSFDHSFYTVGQRAMKRVFAGSRWDTTAYRAHVAEALERIPLLERAAKKIARGSYRVYLAPRAVSDLTMMFARDTIGETSIRRGESSMRLVRAGERKFSRLFSLSEDFRGGETPRFNNEGEVAPECLPLIRNGELANSLVSSRSAAEFNIPSNGADKDESLRSPSVDPGTLPSTQVLASLGTGLYLSNLHYLNWSDQSKARVTGMTRFACFWVEDGKIISPIEDMRFDDTLFNLFGDELEAVTTEREFIPETATYLQRNIGGSRMPGMLIKKMDFTL